MADYNKNNINIDFKESNVSNIENYTMNKTIHKANSAKRHVIKINDIELSRNVYKIKNTIKSKNLITTQARSIAIFCNEYIPEHFPNGKYIEYHLTINGVNYEIEPINSNRNGIKIIKVSDYDFNSDYVEYINEKITTAYLTIIIKTPNNYETPFLSDLKIMVGDSNV